MGSFRSRGTMECSRRKSAAGKGGAKSRREYRHGRADRVPWKQQFAGISWVAAANGSKSDRTEVVRAGQEQLFGMAAAKPDGEE